MINNDKPKIVEHVDAIVSVEMPGPDIINPKLFNI